MEHRLWRAMWRSLAGSVRGDVNFMLSGGRVIRFRVSSGQSAEGYGHARAFHRRPRRAALDQSIFTMASYLRCAARHPSDGALNLSASAGRRGA